MDISCLLQRQARYRPHHPAVIFEEHRLTYAQFNRRVNKLANTMQGMGIKKGDKVATFLNNCLEVMEIYWAAAKIGAVVVPTSTLLRGSGLTTLLNDSDTSLVFANAVFTEALDAIKPNLPAIAAENFILVDGPGGNGYQNYHDLVAGASEDEPAPVEISGDDPYNIVYSSGTTGLPKGIVLTHQVRYLYGALFSASYRMTPESIMLHTGSMVFNGAFLTFMPAFYLGATFILHRQFNAEALIETIRREKVTHIKMVPSQIVALLNSPNCATKNLQSLEMLGSVGAPLHMEYKEALSEVLPDRFYELYGLTEGFMTILDKTDFAAKPQSVGTPMPGTEIRIVDTDGNDLPPNEVGEIIGHSPLLMAGYYKRPDLTAQAVKGGWLYSGDLGFLDADGFLYLVDRKKDMIISGGVNVYPKDIEEVIVQHPAVREAAVFGIPSEKWGETPLATIILTEPDAISAEDLRTWINQTVEAKFQRVHAVIIREDFPRSAAGKTLKRVMREEYWEGRESQI